jgi:hypothetical protein
MSREVGKGYKMKKDDRLPVWAPKVPRNKILRLYTADSHGIVDEELITEVGWGLWSRCDSILAVTTAHYGHLACPSCGADISRDANLSHQDKENGCYWLNEDILCCPDCDWQLPWKAYHQTYRGKQLFGANAVEVFQAFHRAFPKASAPNEKMLLIDQLIHAFHVGLTELGRPVGANLIEGSMKEVIQFLDNLTNGPAYESREVWRQKLKSTSWGSSFLE